MTREKLAQSRKYTIVEVLMSLWIGLLCWLVIGFYYGAWVCLAWAQLALILHRRRERKFRDEV
jgi:hypothetical protein